MRIRHPRLRCHLLSAMAATLISWGMLAGVAVAQGAARSPTPRAAADADMTLVVATRIVEQADAGTSLKAVFDSKRVPESSLNATDRCVEEHALEIAQEYFTTLGTLLGRAAFYYEVPDEEVGRRVEICERMHGSPPQAWSAGKTKMVALGAMLPSAAAVEFEKSLR